MATRFTATLLLMCVYDIRLGAYIDAPLGAPTRGVAERDFENAVNEPKSRFYQYPDDYELHEIGSMDMVSGAITMNEPRPIVYGRAADFKRKDGV